MDNALFVGLSRQITLRRELDIAANNLANADTSGFKVEGLMLKTDPAGPARTLGAPNPVKFVLGDGVARDFGQGSLRRTDAPLDLAIEGKGFFAVTTPDGDRYTRDGRFRLDDLGKLVTEGGQPVQGDGGGEITLDALKGPVVIAADGTISQGIERVGKIGVVRFDDLSVLEKSGDNLLKNTANAPPAAAPDALVRQGMLENSNVKPITEITKLIEVSRAYEQISHMMDAEADLSRRSIERMGRVQ
ncbi:flagellar basal-body rod protein FlgF [Phenylobacterium sp.]|jgi:flagellar basal-body rod protein FlgF|uniref:flagellar basal-body rod protein FlgF n=1 Tax=Phenylobacterium sp. TaxID=1871053 RepID=UPI002F3F5249